MDSHMRRRQMEVSEEQDNLMKLIIELTGDSPVLLWDAMLDYCGRKHPELYNDPDSKFKELVYLYWKYADRYGPANEREERNMSYEYNGMPRNCNEHFYGEHNVPGSYNGEGRQRVMNEETRLGSFNPATFYPHPSMDMPSSPYGIQHQTQEYDFPQYHPQDVVGFPMYPANNFVYSGGVQPFVSHDGTVFPASAVLPPHFIPLHSMPMPAYQNLMSQNQADDPYSCHEPENIEDRGFNSAPGPEFYDGMPNDASYRGPIRPNYHSGGGDTGLNGLHIQQPYLNSDAQPFIPKNIEQNSKPGSPQGTGIQSSVVCKQQNAQTSSTKETSVPLTIPRPPPLGAVVPRKGAPYKGSRSDPLPFTHGNGAKYVEQNVNKKINGLCGTLEILPKGILKTPPNGIQGRFNNSSNKSRGPGKSHNNYVKFADF